eukprot:CAMPEP_0195655862 /NCGR_PEP_ID=MMETSP0815-20121206/34686_1 /TAXON_ID=97485 /ORGANISM="Prymnesium parvum, Strain Texoma1" /LENGTH=72 /DNA_ID=CAMNT_0040800181 /DNA_START=87 /DNA_END=302 /DNA_ORIENTATION=-
MPVARLRKRVFRTHLSARDDKWNSSKHAENEELPQLDGKTDTQECAVPHEPKKYNIYIRNLLEQTQAYDELN